MFVFVVQHVHEIESGTEDVKLIGVFSSRDSAQGAIAYLRSQPGFRESPECICIDKYLLDAANWTEGYLTSSLE